MLAFVDTSDTAADKRGCETSHPSTMPLHAIVTFVPLQVTLT
jgi:hypothetical protein